ncbi:MAG: resolvase [Cyanobacteria bacterium]|nr:resolvase [Cyanobacteriota bacterium]
MSDFLGPAPAAAPSVLPVLGNTLLDPALVPAPAYDVYLTVEDVQRQLRRSRASVYRYANTHPEILNPPFDPNKLNPEVRSDRDASLQFHVREVRRFAQDVLGLALTLAVQPSEETTTHELLRAVLKELQAIRQLLEISPDQK